MHDKAMLGVYICASFVSGMRDNDALCQVLFLLICHSLCNRFHPAARLLIFPNKHQLASNPAT